MNADDIAKLQTPRTNALLAMRNLRWDQLSDYARRQEQAIAALMDALESCRQQGIMELSTEIVLTSVRQHLGDLP